MQKTNGKSSSRKFKTILLVILLTFCFILVPSKKTAATATDNKEILGPQEPGQLPAQVNTEPLGPPAPGEDQTGSTASKTAHYTNPLHIPDFSSFSTPLDLITALISILLWLIPLAAFIGIIYGGFKYITAEGGDTTAAKKTIINSVIALVIGMLALAAIQIVYSFLQ